MKKSALLAFILALAIGSACSAPTDVKEEAFDAKIKPHLSHGCQSWWSLIEILDNGDPDSNSSAVSVLSDTIVEDFTNLAMADPRSDHLAEAAIVVNTLASYTAEEGLAAYGTLDSFCQGFRN